MPALTDADREMLRLAIPAFGALVAEPLYVLSDTAIVGHLGTPQLGGLAVASGILLSGFSIFVFLAYGTTSAVARLLGAGEDREAAHQAVQGVWLAALMGVAVALVVFALSSPLVHAFSGDHLVRHYALRYLRISLLGLPPSLVVLAGTGYLRGLQDTKRPLQVALGTAALNLVLEVLFVYGLGFGVGASALATVLVQWLGGAIYVHWIRVAVARHGVDLRPHFASLRRLLKVGMHLLVRTVALRGSYLLATAVAARMGRTDLAAYEVAFQMLYLLALALDAIAIAGQSIVGRFLGAADVQGARHAATRMLWWAIGIGVVFGVGLVVLRPVLPAIFTDDQAVRALAAFGLLHVAAMQPINGAIFALDGVLIGAGDMRYIALATGAAGAVFVASAAVVLATGAGLGWLWAAIEALMVARFLGQYWRFRSDDWLVTGAVR